MKRNGMEGIRIGHEQHLQAKTGITVVLFDKPAVCGVDVRGGAPGTRETELLRPENTIGTVHALVLAGGSAFGLDACAGVMRYLEERDIGFDTGYAKVPIVPAAVLYDLGVGRSDIRPDAAMGYSACHKAVYEPVGGKVGVGTGCTVGKILGMQQASPGGLGICRLEGPHGLEVMALIAVNAFGDVWEDGKIIAGARRSDGAGFTNSQSLLIQGNMAEFETFASGQNTTIGVIISNAILDKAQAGKVASMGHDGLARAISPIHTSLDGDTLFAATTGQVEAALDQVGTLAALAVQKAVCAAIQEKN